MPRPVSETATTIDSALRVAVTTIRPPAGVNFTALESRLAKTCCRRPASPLRMPIPASSRISSATPLAAATVPHAIDGCLQRGAERDILQPQGHLPEMMRGHVEQILDDTRLQTGVAVHHFDGVGRGLGVEAAAGQHRRPAQHRRQGACAAHGRAPPGTRPWRGSWPPPPAGPPAPGAGGRPAWRQCAGARRCHAARTRCRPAGRRSPGRSRSRAAHALLAGLQLHGLGCLRCSPMSRSQPAPVRIASRHRPAHRGRPGPGLAH
jgi:hypothetical protein